MKTYLLIYPHCYSYVGSHGLFIFEPKTKAYAYLANANCLPMLERNNLLLFLKEDDCYLLEFSKQCIEKKLAYIYTTTSDTLPISRSYNIRFVSSVAKLKDALGYNSGLSILNYITSINIFSGNTQLFLCKNDYYKQLNYPEFSSVRLFSQSDIKSYTYPNLRELIITGDFDDLLVRELVNFYTWCSVIIKTKANDGNIQPIKCLIKEYHNISFNFVIASYDDYLLIRNSFEENIESVAVSILITSVDQINDFKTCNLPTSYIPLLHNTKEQQDLIEEMLLSLHDILGSNTVSIDEIFKREVIDVNNFGCISILSNGDIVSANDFIGNILKDNILNAMTSWLNKESSVWFQSRQTSKFCSGCPLTALCPPLSVYERQGYLERACNNVSIK